VRGINRYGRASQGVRVMNLKDGDTVSAVALVMESDQDTAAGVAEDPAAGAPGGHGPEGNGASLDPPASDPDDGIDTSA
jgi:DNA gyrase subunit A